MVRIIARLTVSGPTRQVCMLHEKLASHFDTRLVIGSLAQGEGDMSYLLPSEHNVLRLSQMSREVSFWSDVVAFWRIFRFLRRERPHIVHTHTAKAGALGRVAAWLAGVPIIVHTYHGHVFHSYFGAVKSRIFVAIERCLGLISTQVIAISDTQFKELTSTYRVVKPERVCVVRNGFDLQRFNQASREEARRQLGIAPDAFVVAWAGRMAPVKDVDLLAQVVKRTEQTGRKIEFLIVGDGMERSVLESLVRDCSNVRLLGWRREMAAIWAAADAALLTSRNEGTPTALIEAMAAGVPFVAANVGGVPDLAVEPFDELSGETAIQAANGFLTARSPEAMVGCIERLMDNPAMARKMASVGRDFVADRFSARRLVEEMQLLYQTLMAKTRPAPDLAVRQAESGAPETGDVI